MAKEPLTWDENGNVVPLTEDRNLTQIEVARGEWESSGNAAIKGPEVMNLKGFAIVGLVLRDTGQMGMEAFRHCVNDHPETISFPFQWIFSLCFWLCSCLFLAIIVFPISLLLRSLGVAIVNTSLRRTATKE